MLKSVKISGKTRVQKLEPKVSINTSSNNSKSTSNDNNRKKSVAPSTGKNNIVLNVAAAYGAQLLKSKAINFKVRIRCTEEIFNVIGMPLGMQIRDLKACLEFICGIPFELQRLSYLDDGEMVDHKELLYYDIIDGAILDMDIWTAYVALVKACVLSGSIDDVLKQGVSLKVDWHSPTSDYMFKKDRVKYITDRSGIALFIASHRGNLQLLKDLIRNGAHTNYASSYGRTPIMVSVVANQSNIIDYLLEKDVNIDLKDINGDTALTIAKKFNNKLGQYRLTQHKWKKRTEAERKKSKEKGGGGTDDESDETAGAHDVKAHQVFDSSKKTWLKGDFMQIYMMQLTPPGEFSGTGLSAPKSVGKRLLKERKEMQRSFSELRAAAIGRTDSSAESPLESATALEQIYPGMTFDMWMNKKLRARRLEKNRNKKVERPVSADNTKDDLELQDLLGGQPFNKNDPESNYWMKDYIKASMMTRTNLLEPSVAFNLGDQQLNSSSNPNSSNDTSLSSTQPLGVEKTPTSTSLDPFGGGFFKSSARKNIELLEVYRGMSYEEWAEIRDKFLKSHRMKSSF